MFLIVNAYNWFSAPPVTVTAVPGQRLTVYLDALEMSFTDLPASPPALTGELSIGAATDGSRPFMGEIDQLEISTTVRTCCRVMNRLCSAARPPPRRAASRATSEKMAMTGYSSNLNILSG